MTFPAIASQDVAALVATEAAELVALDEWALRECRSLALEAFTEAGCTEAEMRDCFTGEVN